MNWRDSKKVICLNYREYSCGRFVSNILSYNCNFLPLYNLDNDTPLDEYSDIKFKHKTILNTIPNSSNVRHWRLHELQCNHFYGLKIEYDSKLIKELFHIPTQQIKKQPLQNMIESIKPRAKHILENNNYFVFFTTHDDLQLKLVKCIFPNAIVVQLTNDITLNDLSKKIKHFSDGLQTKRHYTQVFTYTEDSLKFDIGTIFDKTSFFSEVEKILKILGCLDVTLDPLVYEYYEKYINIYKPYLNTI